MSREKHHLTLVLFEGLSPLNDVDRWKRERKKKKLSVLPLFQHAKTIQEGCLCLSVEVTKQFQLRGCWECGVKGKNRLAWSWQEELGKPFCSRQHSICGNRRECASSREDGLKDLACKDTVIKG